MKCPTCSTELLEVYAFCPQCGGLLPSVEEQKESDSSETQMADGFVPFVPAPAEETSPSDVVSVQLVGSSDQTSGSTDYFHGDAGVAGTEEPVITEPILPTVMSAAAKSASGKTDPSIPKEYKPLKTIGTFFFLLLASIPVIGFIALLIFAFAGKNKSRKSLSRALLLFILIGVILVCVEFIVLFFFTPEVLANLFDPEKWSEAFIDFLVTFFNY
jgi:hypothetical protein